MTTRHWVNGDQGEYSDDTQWQDGVPLPGDTAVIATTGGAMPVGDGVIGDFYSLATGESATDFAGPLAPVLFPGRVINQAPSVVLFVPGLFPTEDQIAPGNDVIGQTVDFLGQGSATGFAFQRTTIEASSTINVSGVAVAMTYYDNVLDGALNIGTPISIGGVPVASPAADSHGATSELDLTISGIGSTDNEAIKLRDYVPTFTNNGVITVGDGAQLRVAFTAGPFAAAETTNNVYVVSFDGRASFVNAGTLDVAAGGSTTIYSVDQLFVTTGADAAGDTAADGDAGVFIWDTVENTGLIRVSGAAGKSTQLQIGGYVTGGGTVSIDGGTQTDNTKTVATFDAVVNNETFVVKNATLAFFDDIPDNTNRVFGGGITLAGNAVLLVDPSTLPSGIGYGPPSYTIPNAAGYAGNALDQAFGTPISGFANGDTLEITVASQTVGFRDTYIPLWDPATDTLTVERSAESIFLGGAPTLTNVATFTLDGSYSSAAFSVLSVTSPTADPLTGQAFFGDVVKIGVLPCFAEGTRIATPSGMIPVEQLRAGEYVLTAGGTIREIVWTGSRHVDVERHPDPPAVRPVRIPAHRFGPSLPARDVYLSPDHAILRNGALVPAKYLVGEEGIAPVDVASVTYWHIELGSHDIVLAEGMPCETLLPGTGRDLLDGDSFRLFDPFPSGSAALRWEALGAAPLRVGA